MRDRLIYLLKHNAVIQTLYVVVMSTFFRFLGLFVKTDNNLVLFVSMMGKNCGDSPRSLYDYMQSCDRYRKYHCVWAFENPADYPEVESVRIDSPAYFMCSLKAKYWITNTNIERGLHYKKKDQLYLNTWHGTSPKTVGNDCPGRKDFDYRNVDFMVVSGRYEEKVFHTAFKTEDKNYIRCGMPRNDRLWHVTAAEKEQERKKLRIPTDKKVILYAPTWRESEDGGKSYEIKPPVHFDEWKKTLGHDYIVFFRAHHLTTKVLGIQFDDFIWDKNLYPDVNDLLIAADILITDYSAIAFDYSILGRPILCFAYDYDSYIAQRGTYFDMSQYYPMPLVKTESELLAQINDLDYERSSKATREFQKKFVEYGGTATQQCVEALFGDFSESH